MTKDQFNERVVELQETRNGRVRRTFYGIHDPDLGYWMSTEPFSGAIWTKDLQCRREFTSQQAAADLLQEFFAWRRRPPVASSQGQAGEPASQLGVAKQDQAGDPIPGSRFVRAFCRTCGEPMRVLPEAFESGTYADCSRCEAEFHPGQGNRASGGGYDGNWDNAVRAVEDAA